jgi:hypothetical protein
MKVLNLLLIIGLVVASSTPVEAAKGKRHVKKTKAAPAKSSSDLGTNFNFDDHGVLGQYQMPDEALVKVENEKTLSDLLGVRKHFKDRLAEASEQE